MSDVTREQVIDWLSGRTIIELAEITKSLETKWGVSAAAPVMAAAAAPGAAAPAAEEKTEFDVVLKAAGEKMQAEVAKLDAAVKAGNLDAIKAAFGAAGGSCKACHDDFRAEKYSSN